MDWRCGSAVKSTCFSFKGLMSRLSSQNPGKENGKPSINNRIQETEEEISGIKDTLENTDMMVKDNLKHKKTS